MYTLGFRFKPWTSEHAIADGPSILTYLKEAAAEFGIDKHIRYHHKVLAADWSDAENKWFLRRRSRWRRDRDHLLVPVRVQRLLQLRRGLLAGVPRFQRLPRHHRSPAALAGGPRLPGKKIVVIGSGATAVTLIPALAEFSFRACDDAAALTDLHRLATRRRPVRRPDAEMAARRSPPISQSGGRPRCTSARDFASPQVPELHAQATDAPWPSGGCPKATTSRSTSARATTPGTSACAWRPTATCSARSAGQGRRRHRHHRPVHQDWHQLCSGEQLDADIIVTATGLNIQLFGGAAVLRNGVPVEFNDTHGLQGHDADRPPNMAYDRRLHQRVVDSEGRLGLRVCLPAVELHGRQRI